MQRDDWNNLEKGSKSVRGGGPKMSDHSQAAEWWAGTVDQKPLYECFDQSH